MSAKTWDMALDVFVPVQQPDLGNLVVSFFLSLDAQLRNLLWWVPLAFLRAVLNSAAGVALNGVVWFEFFTLGVLSAVAALYGGPVGNSPLVDREGALGHLLAFVDRNRQASNSGMAPRVGGCLVFEGQFGSTASPRGG